MTTPKESAAVALAELRDDLYRRECGAGDEIRKGYLSDASRSVSSVHAPAERFSAYAYARRAIEGIMEALRHEPAAPDLSALERAVVDGVMEYHRRARDCEGMLTLSYSVTEACEALLKARAPVSPLEEAQKLLAQFDPMPGGLVDRALKLIDTALAAAKGRGE